MRLRRNTSLVLASWAFALMATAQADGIVAEIDASLEAAWEERGVRPTGQASDAVFLRRASLDLAGVTPSLAEAERYLADGSTDKREALVDRLLASPRYANHMAATWRDLLIPAEEGGFLRREQAIGLENWLRDRFGRNVRYDNVVYDLLVATDASDLGPASYFSAHDLKPEKLAANTTELLLGVSLECAQCHDHPYTSWTEQDFWGFAAFFARVRPADGGMRMAPGSMVARIVDADRGELVRPDREDAEPIPPRFLGGNLVEDDEFETRRERLALWMAERENPYLARAAVNAAWRRLFGAGLVDEINADGAHLPKEHAALLDDIARAFVASKFDVKWLWKQLVMTRAYGLAAAESDPPPVRAFAAMRPRRLTSEQLAASIGRLSPSPLDGGDPFQMDPGREEFVRRMRASSDDSLEYAGSTLQSLRMLHGDAVERVATPQDAGLVPALTAPHLSADDRVEALFLATLTREPTDSERELFTSELEQRGQGTDLPVALGDLLWALVNGTEMSFNH